MESPDWASLSDDELLERKISQLGLKLDGTKLQPLGFPNPKYPR